MKWFMDNWDGMLLWFVIGLIIFLLFGCASNKKEEYYDLLYRDSSNTAYKSITIKDYKCEEEC
jgi:uncharacterized protein YcfL